MTHHDQSEDLLTIADLARNLDLPESTTRYYCKRFATHLPSCGDGRRRRYKPEAEATLRAIAASMRQNKNAFAVDLALRDGTPATKAAPLAETGPVVQEAASSALSGQIMSLMERQTQALQEIAGAMSVFAAKIAAPPAVTESPPPNAEETQKLRDDVATLRQQVRTAEAVHQNDLEQMRKWLSRLGEALARR